MAQLSWLTERPIAHRGLHDGNSACWENTPTAFERAAERGFAIECDVHLSADGVPVVFHDDTLQRLTGEDGLVWQRTAGELAALRVGGTQDRVPTLRAMLDQVAGRVPLVIELKGIAGHDEGLVAAVARELARYEGRAAIMSFDHWLVRRFPIEAPGIPAGLTAWGTSTALIEAHFAMLAHGLRFVSYDVACLPNPFVRFVRERLELPVITWTVRDEAAMRLSREYADQMTFERIDPERASLA